MSNSTRREFLTHSAQLAGGLGSIVSFPSMLLAEAPKSDPNAVNPYKITRDVPTKFYDGKQCYVHPRAGIVPGAGDVGSPRVVMTLNTLDVSGSDVFKKMLTLETNNLGKNWTKAKPSETLAVRYETIDGIKRPVALGDMWPTWHAKSKTLLATGHTVVYTPNWKVRQPRPRDITYSIYNPEKSTWQTWKKVAMPDEKKFYNVGAGCAQRLDLPDGTILLPISSRPPKEKSKVMVGQFSFDGTTLKFLRHGNMMSIDTKTRGLHEPSLAKFQDRYYLTIRNDQRGFVAVSKDGLQFDPYKRWEFDDGKELGSYNTQQHWVTHKNALYLVYTRRGAKNDHVFRHRAPLFIAQVDPKKLHVLRKTERILVPERGARLGNFGVTHVNESETWVTVAEWMQKPGPNHILPKNNPYGSDGSVFVARIHWNEPNCDC